MQTVPFWRVCRVLANRPRLRMLALLSQRPGLRVGEIARAMNLSRPAASQYLRALESCGFALFKRRGRSVLYELGTGKSNPTLRALIGALILRLRDKKAIESLFKLATAFANPGRIVVYRSMSANPQSVAELKSATGLARTTVWRHLQKLQNRSFVRAVSRHLYGPAQHPDAFARALAAAATE